MAAFAGKSRIANGGTNDLAILNSFYQLPGVLGNVIHVYSGALGTATGTQVTDAALTMIAGQTLATADNDDVVLVLPGHTEAVTGAAGMTFSKAGVTYQGVGRGTLRPTINFTTAIGAQIIVSGARITFKNIIFNCAGFDAITAAISVTGAYVTFDDCDFITNSATAGCVLGVLTAATATAIAFKRCRFIGAQTNSGTTTTAQIQHEVGDDAEISDCWFTGKCTQSILNVTASVLRIRILRNYFHVYTGTVAVTVSTTCTGLMADNSICVASGTAPVVGTALSFSNNHYTTEGNGPTAGTALAF